jgi:hypothetical protein
LLQLVISLIEFGHRIRQFRLQRRHLQIESGDVILANQANAWLGIRQRQAAPEVQDTATRGGDQLEAGMRRVEQLLGRADVLASSAERIGCLGFLLWRQRLTHAKPHKGDPHGRHRRAESLGGINGGAIGVRVG